MSSTCKKSDSLAASKRVYASPASLPPQFCIIIFYHRLRDLTYQRWSVLDITQPLDSNGKWQKLIFGSHPLNEQNSYLCGTPCRYPGSCVEDAVPQNFEVEVFVLGNVQYLLVLQ